jgi:F0F1-type ATP synthase delta subunit
MYAAELFEHTQQVYSSTTIYLCLMPVEISSIVCAVLTIELLINIWATFHIGFQEMRDRLILLDIFTDIFCVAFPLGYSRFYLAMPIQLESMLFIVVYPTLSLYSKLNDIWEDYFKMDLERIEQTKKQKNSTRSSRRKSILNLSHNRDTLETQLKHFPKWLRYIFTVLNIGFVLFFVSLVSVHLATQPSTDKCSGMFTNEVWEGCQVKVPFCQDLFVAKCDCAVLGMTNYTQRALPASFGGLKSLVKLGVYTGQLEELPQPLGDNHKRIIVLMVIGNKLESLPDSVGNLQNLLTLLVFNNRLESLPDSVGNLQNLLYLTVFNNRLESLPDSVGNLQNLIYLKVSNNTIESLPDSVGNLQNLLYLYAWNNTLTALPTMVGDMKSLIAVDVRHNGLTDLPSSVAQWSKVEYFYLAGNPLCADLEIPSNLKEAKGLCEQQCSADCPGDDLGDGECDDNDVTYQLTKNTNPNVKPKPNSGCNTDACEYDKGDCPR